MKDLITIGLPSKGRLKEKAIDFFTDKGLKILQNNKERNYFASIENHNNIQIIFLHNLFYEMFQYLTLNQSLVDLVELFHNFQLLS